MVTRVLKRIDGALLGRATERYVVGSNPTLFFTSREKHML